MKNSTLSLLLLLSVFSVHSKDILTLNSQEVFEGKIVKIKNCKVTIKAYGDTYEIPASDIFSIQFENTEDKVYRKYLNKMREDPNVCLKGTLDAEHFHGKKGSHFILGALFGPFAMIGTALANPYPEKGRATSSMSQNRDLFDNLEYRSCYKKKAKKQLIGMEALGWGAWILFALTTGLQ